MVWRLLLILSCVVIVAGRTSAQEVIIVREQKPQSPSVEPVIAKQPANELRIEKAVAVQAAKSSVPTQPAIVRTQVTQPKATIQPAAVKPQPVRAASTSTVNAPKPKPESVAVVSSTRTDNAFVQASLPSVNFRGATAFTKLADGFDFPIGKPDSKGYYKARGFRSHGHLGEDWDGVGGGDTDLGDPIYCIGDGVVVFARDCKMGWGNVIIVRHAFREGGTIKNIDSFYGHLQRMMVRSGEAVSRGQQIATMGNAHGLYDAHLHLEIRKNLEIGMSRAAFARDFNNYYDPTQFITSHRVLRGGGGTYRIAMNTFTRDKSIRWDKKRYFTGYRGGGGGESAIALKKALASESTTAR